MDIHQLKQRIDASGKKLTTLGNEYIKSKDEIAARKVLVKMFSGTVRQFEQSKKHIVPCEPTLFDCVVFTPQIIEIFANAITLFLRYFFLRNFPQGMQSNTSVLTTLSVVMETFLRTLHLVICLLAFVFSQLLTVCIFCVCSSLGECIC